MNRDLVRFDRSITIAILILAAFVPFLLTTYEIKLATTVLIQAGLAASLGLVVGMAGLVSVGHAAFYGIAAYLVVIAAPQTGSADLFYTAAIAVLGATVFAGLVGAVSIRSRGLYFILMTLAFGQLGYHFFHDTGLVGSADGSYLNARPELRFASLSLSLDKPGELYVLVWTVVCAVVLVCWCVRRSAFGQIVMAARDNEARVRAFGYSPYLLRLSLFLLSGAMAGAMGYLTAIKDGFVTPEFLNWHLSATILVMVLIGGKDTLSGPVVGAVLLVLAEEILQRYTEFWIVGIGLIIIATVVFAPRGLVPFTCERVMWSVFRIWKKPQQRQARSQHG
jgi:branched-chain amino acid transport system permease protein